MADNDGAVATPDALEQVDALKARLQQNNVALEEANRRTAQIAATADAALAEAAAARAAVQDVNATSRTTDIDRAKADMTALEKEYGEAFTAGDGAAVAAANGKMARLGARIERLEGAVDTTQRQAQPSGRVQADNGNSQRIQALMSSHWVGAGAQEQEAFLNTRSPQTAAWLRMHPEYFGDRKFNAKVRAADTEWDADGKPRDTPEYFDFIERRAGLAQDPAQRPNGDAPAGDRRQPAVDPAQPAQAGTRGTAATLTPAGVPDDSTLRTSLERNADPQRPRRGTPVAAPPTRDGAPALSGRPSANEVRITKEEQEWAKMIGITPEEYHAGLEELRREGDPNGQWRDPFQR